METGRNHDRPAMQPLGELNRNRWPVMGFECCCWGRQAGLSRISRIKAAGVSKWELDSAGQAAKLAGEGRRRAMQGLILRVSGTLRRTNAASAKREV